jgi:hypothetical protein
MSFKQWLSSLGSAIQSRDTRGALEQLDYAYNGAWLSATSRYPIGTNVFSMDWDTLIILDACRLDALKEIATDFDYIKNVDSIWSVGSSSHEWYANTFRKKYESEISDTALISSNPFAVEVLRNNNHPPIYPVPFLFANWSTVTEDSLGYLELTQQHERPFDDMDVQDPNYITDQGIIAGRKNFNRLIVHYFQPHRPFIYDLIEGGSMSELQYDPYGAAQKGKIGKEDLWEMYIENLRCVLKQVRVFLNNHDAGKAIITADHGELIGELGQYGHFEGVPHPALKRVPWAEAVATDNETKEPEEQYTLKEKTNQKERLENLGYL